nr:conserved Plasmodium protein, unknown function [Plasmodium sp. DRC-Itaito]
MTLEEFLEYSLNTNYKIKTSVTSQKMSNKNKREDNDKRNSKIPVKKKLKNLSYKGCFDVSFICVSLVKQRKLGETKEYPSFVNLYALIVQLPGVNEHESEFLNFSPIYEHYYKVNNLDVRMRNILENDLNNYFALSILVKNLKWKCSTPHETLEEFLEYSLNTNYKIKTSVTSQKMSNKNKREDNDKRNSKIPVKKN